MADFVSELAAKAGISEEKAKEALATVLAQLKGALTKAQLAKVETSMHGAKGLLSDTEAESDAPQSASAPAGGGGFLALILSLLAKLFGGGKGMDILSKLSALGLTPEQIAKLGGGMLEHLKHLPPGLLNKITAQMMPGGAAEGAK